jgi:hypothetical protein
MGTSTSAAWRPRRKDSKLGRVPNPNHVWYSLAACRQVLNDFPPRLIPEQRRLAGRS